MPLFIFDTLLDFFLAVMGKNILKVDPVALGFEDIDLQKEDFIEENDFEWDQNDLEGADLEKVLNEPVGRDQEISLDRYLEDDDI
ncbi:hypothetical protein DDZ16_04320 [Marinilabilia rubra]|uniref:Uncharacterized protein n=2 Tax=Marinilabilia rubra TaxID=2162893 RepID=A0A2U2BCM7_9BACT|nr:hypothetical protein DDZ16_04320 [Marinilabilia rubra]